MATFALSVRSMTELHPQIESDDRSTTTGPSPLHIIIQLPNGRASDPLYPATHLQVVLEFEQTGKIFLPELITSSNLVRIDANQRNDLVPGNQEEVEEAGQGEQGDLYGIIVDAGQIPRIRTDDVLFPSAQGTVGLIAWKKDKILGTYQVGSISGVEMRDKIGGGL